MQANKAVAHDTAWMMCTVMSRAVFCALPCQPRILFAAVATAGLEKLCHPACNTGRIQRNLRMLTPAEHHENCHVAA